MEVVTAGLLSIYQIILGLKFTRLEGMEVWHDEVDVYKVNRGSIHTILRFSALLASFLDVSLHLSLYAVE